MKFWAHRLIRQSHLRKRNIRSFSAHYFFFLLITLFVIVIHFRLRQLKMISIFNPSIIFVYQLCPPFFDYYFSLTKLTIFSFKF